MSINTLHKGNDDDDDNNNNNNNNKETISEIIAGCKLLFKIHHHTKYYFFCDISTRHGESCDDPPIWRVAMRILNKKYCQVVADSR